MKKKLLAGLAVGVMMAGAAGVADAALINWTDWVSSSTGPDTVKGTIGGVGVTYTGDFAFVQTGSGTNFWTEPVAGSEPYTGNSAIDNAPTPSEMIALDKEAWHTFTFSEAVYNPVMALVSMGQTLQAKPVTYAFDQPFSLLSNGIGFWSYTNGGLAGSYSIVGNSFTGSEVHAAIQFSGWVDSISWQSRGDEYWHGVTVGASPVPEPATMLLFGAGLAGLAAVGRRRKK